LENQRIVGAGVDGTDADGTEPSRPPSSPEVDESEGSEGSFKARRWHLDILRARLGRGSAVDIFASRELDRTETV
jgi:hypothetical protein